ncbi:MAG: tetratricopeptide repeat protein, partial [bacterium]|nr:tetratricopeptide repeat protein [bacterium]
MKPRSTVLFSLILLLALPLWAESVPDRKDRHLEKAISGGLAPTDFHHLFLAFAWRNTEPDWKAVDANIRRLELVTADPLMVDELRLIRSRMAVAEGRPTAARDGFRAMGGLQRWWATDSIDLPELEDFDEQAMLPGPDTEWRAVPGTDTTGWVRLEGIEWPVHRRLVYLATTAHSDKEQPAALRLGAAEAARAWVNGVQVLSTDFPLDRAPDQAAGGAWLRQGANAIVVAVATETSDWWLRARLTAVDGSTLAGVTEIDAVPARFAAGEKAAPEVRTVESAIRTAIEGGDQDARLALAAYLVDRRPFPRSSGVAQEACRRARAVDPAAARLLEWLVTTEPKQRRQLLEEVRSLDDSLTPARIGLAQWYNERGLDQEAYGVLEGADDPWSTAIRLDIDFERWGALVLHDMAALSREHPRAVETGVIVARRAVDARWWPLAREILARLEELTPGIAGVTEIRERLAQECGDVAELRVLLRSALDEDPNRPGLRVRVARAALAEGEAADALRVLQDGLTRCPRHPDLLLELAGVQHLRGDDESAMVLTRRLLEARPQDRQAQRLLELLGGEAEDRSWLRQPEQLWQLAEKIQDSTTPAVAVVEHTEIRFLPGNSTEERVQRAILINV